MNTVTLPDGPSLPRFMQGGMALAAPLWTMRRLRERYEAVRSAYGQESSAHHGPASNDHRRRLGHRPEPVLVRVLDVRDAADQHRFAAEVREWLTAPLAAVFNNAGVAVASSVLDADPDDDEWLRQINFDGVVNGTRAFLPSSSNRTTVSSS